MRSIPSTRHDRTARHQSNTIAKPTSDAISSSGASIASSNSGALPPDTRKPPELTFQCYASQQRNSGKPSTRPSTTLADLFVLPFCADPLSAVRALMRRQSNDEIDDGSAHGWQAGLRWWYGDSFLPASLW